MKNIFFAFAAFLFVISACSKKDNYDDIAKSLLIGHWNEINISTRTPTGKYLKLNAGGSLESNVFTGFDSYEIKNNQLILKGSTASTSNIFSVSSDSLYIESITACPGGPCATLYARQK